MIREFSASGLNSLLEQLRPLRDSRLRLLLPLGFAGIALLLTAGLELLWNSPALLIFAAAVALSTTLLGLAAGLITVVVSTLAVDFFYLPPIFTLNLDGSTLRVGLEYACIAAITHIATRRISARVRRKAHEEAHARRKLGTFGELDGVVDGEVYGWAFDADNPSAPINVVIYVNDRPVAEAAAVYYRPDVASGMNCSGRHGFYVDLSSYCSMETEAVIEARFSNPKTLTNSPIRAKIPARTERKSPTVLFMHIAKTAGTAFREAIVANYKEAEIAYVYPDPPGFSIPDLRQLPLQQRSWFRLVIGHFRYGAHEWFPQESMYVTVVRHPLARVVSHYLYLPQTHPNLIREGERRLSLEELLERRVSVDLDNALVRCFGGIDDDEVPPGMVDREAYERAVYFLRTAFGLVGHQECAQEFYDALRERFDWRANSQLPTVNRNMTASDLMEQEKIRKAVEYHNRWDYLFYEEVLRLFPRELSRSASSSR